MQRHQTLMAGLTVPHHGRIAVTHTTAMLQELWRVMEAVLTLIPVRLSAF